MDMATCSNYILGIPWKIHKELDGLKNHRDWKTAKRARDASKSIEFILKFLSYRVLPQNKVSYDKAKALFDCEDKDDGILQAVVQLKSQRAMEVMFYSEDVNLKNKPYLWG